MTTVLVVHATQMGSTAEIAHAVADGLTARGLESVIFSAEAAPAPDRFDAVVVGSAIYLGHWLPHATDYLRDHRGALTRRPVFLFQSGPCGEDAESAQVKVPGRIARLSRAIGCQPPVTFGGVLEKSRAVGRLSRWMADGAFAGDYRDWGRIAAWADLVADQLGTPPATAGTVVPGTSNHR